MHTRSHTRGVVLAVAVKLVAVLVFAYFGAKVTAAIAESNGAISPLASGPFEVYSIGWQISQAAGFLIGLLAGYVCGRYSPSGTWRAPAILIAGYLLLGVMGVPASANWALSAYWVLAAPVSLFLGVAIYKRKESTHAV